MNELKQEQSYSSLTKMEDSAHVESMLSLGRRLVSELQLEESTDTLGRWMAHYIAELMSKIAVTTGDEKIAAERECFATILELWKHRSALPDGSRPFEDLEPVIRAVESLDPESNIPRYFRAARPPKEAAAEVSEQKKWLDVVEGLDYSAKNLISYCLSKAAENALNKSQEWVKLASVLDRENSASEVVINFISSTSDLNKGVDKNEANRSIVEDKIKRLRGFVESINALISALDERLQILSVSPTTQSVTGEIIIAPGSSSSKLP